MLRFPGPRRHPAVLVKPDRRDSLCFSYDECSGTPRKSLRIRRADGPERRFADVAAAGISREMRAGFPLLRRRGIRSPCEEKNRLRRVRRCLLIFFNVPVYNSPGEEE